MFVMIEASESASITPTVPTAAVSAGGWLSVIAIVILGTYYFYRFFRLSSIRARHEPFKPSKEAVQDALVLAIVLILFGVDLASSGHMSAVAAAGFALLWVAAVVLSYFWYRSGYIFWEDLLQRRNGRRHRGR